MEHVWLDIETTGLNPHTDKIIGIGLLYNSGASIYHCFYTWDAKAQLLFPVLGGPSLKEVCQLLLRENVQIHTFNAAFDLKFLFMHTGINLIPQLHTEVMLLKHTVDENQPFALKAIAAQLFGHDVKAEQTAVKESIKANGGSTNEYYKADSSLLQRYCLQDCALTKRVEDHYITKLIDKGLEQFFYEDEVMPLYKEVTIPMEMQGIHLDTPKAVRVQSEAAAYIVELETEIQTAIAPLLSVVFEPWFLNKDYPLSTFKNNLTVLGRKFKAEPSLTPFEFQFLAWQADCPKQFMFNLQSNHHLKKLFFDTLNLTPLSKTPTGLPQVDEEFLNSINIVDFPWISLLITYNKMCKLKSTYLDRLIEESVNGVFYPSFKQHGTVSGRYGSDIQQLPKPTDKITRLAYFVNSIRDIIIPRPNHVLLAADYEQLEPTIFSDVSTDQNLQAIFLKGHDFYSTIAIETEQLRKYSADKKADNYLGKLAPEIRNNAKPYALGIPYGMTDYKLQFELNISQANAADKIKAYLSAYPSLADWMQRSKELAIKDGFIKTKFGRVRNFPMLPTLARKYGSCIFNDLELWKVYHSDLPAYQIAKSDRKRFKNELNNAINIQVQAAAASIVNRSAIALARKGFVPIMQVHDELVYDLHVNNVETSKQIIQETMQSIVKLSVPLKTTPKLGQTYKECK